jgi:hypothetical protein
MSNWSLVDLNNWNNWNNDVIPNVKTLNLSNNNLTEIPIKVFKLINLEILNLSNNNIINIPDKIKKLKNLQEINLLNNNNIDLSLLKLNLNKRYEKYIDNNIINFPNGTINNLNEFITNNNIFNQKTKKILFKNLNDNSSCQLLNKIFTFVETKENKNKIYKLLNKNIQNIICNNINELFFNIINILNDDNVINYKKMLIKIHFTINKKTETINKFTEKLNEIKNKITNNTIDKNDSLWISKYNQYYKNKINIMKFNENYNIWTEFLNLNEKFLKNKKYDIKQWNNNLNLIQIYINENNFKPTKKINNNVEINKLSSWFNTQKYNYKNQIFIMKNDEIYNKFTEFLNLNANFL